MPVSVSQCRGAPPADGLLQASIARDRAKECDTASVRRSIALFGLLALACGETEGATTVAVDPNAFVLAPGFTPDPQVKTGQAGGPVQAEQWNQDCRGYVTERPSHTIVLERSMPQLRVVVYADGDPTLVLRMGDGSYRCNDDFEGLHSMVEGSFPAGTHQVFVGTYGSGGSFPYAIGVSQGASLQPSAIARSLPAPPPSPPTPPMPPDDPPPPPMPPPGAPSGPQPDVVLSRGRLRSDPTVQASWAGGPTPAEQVGPDCAVGHYPTAPQHTLVVDRAVASLRLLVSSSVDTTLAVRAPDGTVRCIDDADGLNPAIDGPFAVGRHAIYVGTYSFPNGGAYRLAITTDATLNAATLATLEAGGTTIVAVPVAPPDVPPDVRPPPLVDPPGGRHVPGALPGDMSPEGLTPAQRGAADGAGISYHEARELHRCNACMRDHDFDHCIMMCREPCLECVTSGPATEGRCGPPCGGRR